MIEGIKKTMTDFVAVENSVIDLDGAKALQMQYSAVVRAENGQRLELMLMLWMLSKNGLQYGITTSCLKDDYERNRDTFFKSVSTFDAPYALDASQKANALTPKTDIWHKWILPILAKGTAQFIVGGTIALIAGIVGVFRG